MPKILASLRSADLTDLAREIERLEAAGIDGYHIDVMDGRFVEETCFEPDFVSTLRPMTARTIDVHLMAVDPEPLARSYAAAGADRVSIHLEATAKPRDLLRAIRQAGARPGLVLLPGTPVEDAFELFGEFELVNPLGVDPTRGLGFQTSTFERIAALVAERARRGLDFVVQADGGVWEKTRDDLEKSGADELVGGFPIFSQDDYAVAVEALRTGAV